MSTRRPPDSAPTSARNCLAYGATLGFALVAALSLLTGFAWSDAWTAADKAVLASMSLDRLPPVPRDPSNAVEAVPAAVALGQHLFADVRLSSNQSVSCATCHAPDRQFQDGLAVGHGVGTGSRRTMPIAGAAYSPWYFWDGRKDSLWSQALGPLEDAVEHGSNRTRIAKLLHSRYKADYEALFGPMPDLAMWVTPVESSYYDLTVWNEKGCSIEDKLYVRVTKELDVYVPNSFSPNSDGTNDLFTIYARAASVRIVKRFQVFDRFGEMVFVRENSVSPSSETCSDISGNDERLMTKAMINKNIVMAV